MSENPLDRALMEFPDGTFLGEGVRRLFLATGGTAEGDLLGFVQALAEGAAFPADERLELANEKLKGGAEEPFRFATDGEGKVELAASSSARLVLDPGTERIRELLGFDEESAPFDRIGLDPGNPFLFLALVWSYGASVGAEGSVGLGARGAVTFDWSGQGSRLLAVVHKYGRQTKLSNALADTGRGFRLPKRVERPGDLPARTWLVSEVDGSLELGLGVTYGYDFNSLREVDALGLQGDIGLRIKLALEADLGFSAAGKHLLVVSRETADDRLRVRLFKARNRTWNFALDASATVHGELGGDLAKEDTAGLLAAALNLHSRQVLDDVFSWAAGDESLDDLFGAKAREKAKEFLHQVTGVDVDEIDAKIAEIRAELEAVREKWNGLDARIAAEIWGAVEDGKVGEIRELLEGIAEALDPGPGDGAGAGDGEDGLVTRIRQELTKAGFFTSPAGRWLQLAAEERLVGLLAQPEKLREKLSAATEKTLEILDGAEGEIEGALTRLREGIEATFGLDRLEEALDRAIEATDPGERKLDSWLAERIGAVLDDLDQSEELEKLKETIDGFHTRAGKLLAATREALQRKYEASFALAYEKATTKTALIDAELDFAEDADGSVSELLRELLDGRFARLLTRSHRGVTLHAGVLTHEVRRERSLELEWPGGFRNVTHLNQALGKLTAVDDGGRVLIFEGIGVDEVEMMRRKVAQQSRLSVTVALPRSFEGVRIHRQPELVGAYRFEQKAAGVRRARLASQLEPYVERHLGHHFGNGSEDTPSDLESWLSAVDAGLHGLDAAGAANLGHGNIGNVWLSFEAGVSRKVGEAWLRAPEDGDPRYAEMSLRIQALFKELVTLLYFNEDLKRYGSPVGDVVLAWSILEPINRFQRPAVGSAAQTITPVEFEKVRRDLHWGVEDRENIRALLARPFAAAEVGRRTQQIRQMLRQADLSDDRFTNAQVVFGRLAATWDSSGHLRSLMRSLLVSEKSLVLAAAKAGLAMAEVRTLLEQEPGDRRALEKAVAATGAFAGALAKAFNVEVRTVVTPHSLRAFGTLIMSEAAEALAGTTFDGRSPKLLRLAVLDPEVDFDSFEGPPAADQVLVEQTLVG